MKQIIVGIILVWVCSNVFAQDVRTQYFPKTTQIIKDLPSQQNLWVFIMAGQSNMAGRGLVEPQDTLANPRILTLNKSNELVLAKEPLHYYEPSRTGLDCGLSFAKILLQFLPDSISLLLLPTAVGGSSIQQWLGDSTHNGVKLLSNAAEKIGIARKIGTMKGILWHQGETNANDKDLEAHPARLAELVAQFRSLTGVQNLPILVAELGKFEKYKEFFPKLNEKLAEFVKTDKYAELIQTGDLTDKGDSLHFNGASQRTMGERFAQTYLLKFLQK